MIASPSLKQSFNHSQVKFLTSKQYNPHLPLLIYFPGMDGSGKLFANQIKKLSSCFTVKCLSIPPDDLSEWETLTNIAIELIEAELDKLGAKTLYLCGESFGGCLALKILETRPELIETLILVNPASSFNYQPVLSLGIPILQNLPDLLHYSSTVAFVPFLAELSRIERRDRKILLQGMKSLSAKVVSWRLSLLKEFTISQQSLVSFNKPTLVIASGSDRLLPSILEAKRLVNLLPQATIEILPQSGHACLAEKDTDLYEIMRKHQMIASNFCF